MLGEHLPGGRAQGPWGSTSQVGRLRGAGGAPPRWAGSGVLGEHLPGGKAQGPWGSTSQVGRLRGAGGAPPRWAGSGALREHLPSGRVQGCWGSTSRLGRLRGAEGAPPGWAGSGALGEHLPGGRAQGHWGWGRKEHCRLKSQNTRLPPPLTPRRRQIFAKPHSSSSGGLEPVQGSFSLVEGDRQAHLLGCRGGLKSLGWSRWTPLSLPSDPVRTV